MTTSVTITGTGFPAPSTRRAGPGVLVRVGDVALQFDAGRSTVRRLTACGLEMTDLDAVFVTHHHSDHLTDLQDIVLTRWIVDRGAAPPPLPIVAPDGPAIDFLSKMMIPWEADIAVRMPHMGRDHGPEYEVRPFTVPDTPTEVWSGGATTVLACHVRHEPVHPAVGYRVETPDGVVAISGDTLVCDEVAQLAAGADVLVYEAMRFEAIQALPPERRFILDYHADSRLIGAQARELGVPTLVLTHLCPEPTTEAERRQFIDDIRGGGFDGELVVADDLDTVHLTGAVR